MPDADQGPVAATTCVCCGASLDGSVRMLVRGYCDVCCPDACPECGCENIRQRRSPDASDARTKWRCDNGCFFEVTEP